VLLSNNLPSLSTISLNKVWKAYGKQVLRIKKGFSQGSHRVREFPFFHFLWLNIARILSGMRHFILKTK